MDNTTILILLIILCCISVSSAIGVYYNNNLSTTTPTTGTTPSTNPPADTTAQKKVETCTTTNQADGKCRTYWDCYLGDTVISAGESIHWGHTSGDASWACNEWKGNCNKSCTAQFRSDLTTNPPAKLTPQ